MLQHLSTIHPFLLQNTRILLYTYNIVYLSIYQWKERFVIVYGLGMLGIMLLLFVYMSLFFHLFMLVIFIFKVGSQHIALASPVLVM